MGSQVAILVPDKKLDRFVLDKILRGESKTIYFFIRDQYCHLELMAPES